MKVSALIDPTTRKWDLNMLYGLFTTQEIELILSIPLCPNAVEDVVVWPFTPSGTYTVKFGTQFLTSDQAPYQPMVNGQPENDVWKLIWNLNVQSKVRNFLWRSCHNAIPMKQNLKRRHILNEDVCELCKLETESVFHALWGCTQLTQVWGSIPSFSFRQTQAFSSIREVLIYTQRMKKIRSCWRLLCGLSGIVETKSGHLPRTTRCRR
nr:putative ribonuclease h protein [Quercus suber]